jgi:hypothetical protein
MICLQEMKREQFDQNYIKNFCTHAFDKFEFVPSVETSGGTIVCWKSSRFIGNVTFQNSIAMSLELCFVLSGQPDISLMCMPPAHQRVNMFFLIGFNKSICHQMSIG